MALIIPSATTANSMGLIFPLQTEVTIKLSDWPDYISKITKLFQFYNNQLAFRDLEIENYDLNSELLGLATFFKQLEGSLKTPSEALVISTDINVPIEKYDEIYLKIIPNTETNDIRNFSDGTLKSVIVYNKISYVDLKQKNPVNYLNATEVFGISPSTLSLVFNIKQILDKQIIYPIDNKILLCNGRQTTLSEPVAFWERARTLTRDDGFGAGLSSIFGGSGLSSRVHVEDFIAAYIHPSHSIVSKQKSLIKGCTPELSLEAIKLKSEIFFSPDRDKNPPPKTLEEKKKRLYEIEKICSDKIVNTPDWDKLLQDIKSLGSLSSKLLEKYNLECIIDEAIKCVTPQISCEEILRNISVDNFEQRLMMAFPHMKNIIHAISLNVQQELQRQQEQNPTQLTADQQTQIVLDSINTFIDIEALCKIDIQAIIDLLNSLKYIKFPNFNIFDWKFDINLELDKLIIEALFKLFFTMIEQILNELIGCDSLDGFIAGIINENVDAPSGLYGDLATLFTNIDYTNPAAAFESFQQQFGSTFDNSQTKQIFEKNWANFITQSNDEFGKLLRFEFSASNASLGTGASAAGPIGISLIGDSIPSLVATPETNTNLFGGLIRTKQIDTITASNEAGIGIQPIFDEKVIDIGSLSDKTSLEILDEVGKFIFATSREGDLTVSRVSDDSIVNLTNFFKESPEIQTQINTVSQAINNQASQTQQNDIFSQLGVRNKNRHILNALAILNERDNRTSIFMNQSDVANEIKDFIKTTFALLSPTEVISLLSGNPSLEIQLTVLGIAKVRYPLLHLVFKYPERYKALFTMFGKTMGLAGLQSRLDILASSPKLSQKMVDPNICRPFSNIYDFREALMTQALPEDLANKLINDLVNDDVKRANNIMNSLADLQKNPINDLLTNKDALSVNKTVDGKKIEEIDLALYRTVSNVFDQIKIKFDEDLESYPDATSLPEIMPSQKVYKFVTVTQPKLYGFRDVEATTTTNQEFINISNSLGTNAESIIKEPGSENPYFERQSSKKKTGKLFKNIFDNYDIDFSFITEGNLYTIAGKSNLKSETETDTFRSSSYEIQFPNWRVEYKELLSESKYKFSIRTAGQIQNSSGVPLNFNEKILLSGTIKQISEPILQEIENLGALIVDRLSVYRKIIEPQIKKIFSFGGANYVNGTNVNLYFKDESNKSYTQLIENSLGSNIDYSSSKLLKEVPLSSDFDTDKKTAFLNLIDFSPQESEEMLLCGIESHLLQVEAVKKRIMEEFNNSVPDNMISTDSYVNTRYKDNKPNHLSKQIMFGLVDTYIRTVVVHNIFKGLFIFDKYKFKISNFSYSELIYSYIKYKVTQDIQSSGLQQDFEQEYTKILKIYKDQNLINSSGNISELEQIITYHFESVLGLLKKMLGQPIDSITDLGSINFNLPFNVNNLFSTTNNLEPDLSNYTQYLRELDTNIEALNNQTTAINTRKTFFDNISASTAGPIDTYSNFYDINNEVVTVPGGRVTFSRPNTEGSDTSITVEEFTYSSGLVYPKDDYKSFTSIIDNHLLPFENKGARNILTVFGEFALVLEKYVKLQFVDSDIEIEEDFKDLFNLFKQSYFLHDKINITNFIEICAILSQKCSAIYQNIGQGSLQTGPDKTVTLWAENLGTLSIMGKFLKTAPKFGLRLSLIKMNGLNEPINTDGFIDKYKFEYNSDELEMRGTSTQETRESNRQDKCGSFSAFRVDSILQPNIMNFEDSSSGNMEYAKQKLLYQKLSDTYGNDISSIRDLKLSSVIPILDKEVSVPQQLFYINKDSINTILKIKDFYNIAFKQNLKSQILNDQIFDLLANYCIPIDLASTMALFNSMVGMNNEQMYKLFDQTKEIIKNTFIVHKNTGNFKRPRLKKPYDKNKEIDSATIAKAAVRVPVGVLKGLSTVVDPNIFLADKIVLAGKLGLSQPRFKRFKAGEKIKQAGSNTELEITSEVIALDGTFEIVEGQYRVKEGVDPQQNTNLGGNPLPDYTAVALVEDLGNGNYRLKKENIDGEQKEIIRYGVSFYGIPWNIEENKAQDENFDPEDIDIFDIRPSTLIFPGEKLNIPYKVASLALAPFPVFTPGFTTYNVAMPFGPMFLALEDLLAETPEFKQATFKKGGATDTTKNFTCNDDSSEDQTDEET